MSPVADSGHQLVIDQIVPASKQAVFKAWTTASELRQWWGPPGGSCSDAEMDLRVGGQYMIRNQLADGSAITIQGEFLEIEEPNSLTYSWTVDPSQPHREHVVARFEDHPDGTLVTITHTRIASAAMAEGHQDGWLSCLDGLVTHLGGYVPGGE